MAADTRQPHSGLRPAQKQRHHRRGLLPEKPQHSIRQRAADHHRTTGETMDKQRQECGVLRLQRKDHTQRATTAKERRHHSTAQQRRRCVRGDSKQHLQHSITKEHRREHRHDTLPHQEQRLHSETRPWQESMARHRQQALTTRQENQRVERD